MHLSTIKKLFKSLLSCDLVKSVRTIINKVKLILKHLLIFYPLFICLKMYDVSKKNILFLFQIINFISYNLIKHIYLKFIYNT